MLVPDVKIAARGRILGDAWRLQKDLIERRVIALRQGFDGLPVQIVTVHPDLGQDKFSGGIQALNLRNKLGGNCICVLRAACPL